MRLADLLAGLSRVADVGFGMPTGEAVRASALSAGMAASLDLADDDVRAGLYSGLLLHLGCIGYAHETAQVFGDELAGEDIPVGARLAVLATTASLFDTIGGLSAAVAAVRAQSGGILDPRLASHFIDRADDLLGAVNADDPSDLVLDAEPAPVMTVAEQELAGVAAVFGDIADLKSPHMHGHSSGVARLARAGGERLQLSSTDLADVHLAGLLHDVGRVAISNSVWEKPDRLTAHEWEQVRLHAYHSERILTCAPRLVPIANLVGLHHERCDGSGYHRGNTRAALPMPARLLAAADAYHAMTQWRPHRPALMPEQAEQQLLDDAGAGLSTTCSTSTPRSVCPAEPLRHCSPWSTICSFQERVPA